MSDDLTRIEPVGAYWCGYCHKLISAFSDLTDGDVHATCGRIVEWMEAEDSTPLSKETAVPAGTGGPTR